MTNSSFSAAEAAHLREPAQCWRHPGLDFDPEDECPACEDDARDYACGDMGSAYDA